VEVKNTYLDARFIHGLQFKDYATVKVTVEDVDEPPVSTVTKGKQCECR